MDQSEPTPSEQFKESTAPPKDSEPVTEETLWDGGYSGKAMVGSWILAGLGTIGGIALCVFVPVLWIPVIAILAVVWLVLGCMLAYEKLSVHYELTTHRFNHKKGILKRVSDRIETIDIDDVTYEQGIVQRMLNVGTIRITSSDRTHPELKLIGIHDVERVAKMIDAARRTERERRGLYIEAI